MMTQFLAIATNASFAGLICFCAMRVSTDDNVTVAPVSQPVPTDVVDATRQVPLEMFSSEGVGTFFDNGFVARSSATLRLFELALCIEQQPEDVVATSLSAISAGHDWVEMLGAVGYDVLDIFPSGDGGLDIQHKSAAGLLVLEIDSDGHLQDACLATAKEVLRPRLEGEPFVAVLNWLSGSSSV